MTGQMKSYKDKQKMAEDFILRTDPYKKQESLKFDLRGYAAYVTQNNLGQEDQKKCAHMFMKK